MTGDRVEKRLAQGRVVLRQSQSPVNLPEMTHEMTIRDITQDFLTVAGVAALERPGRDADFNNGPRGPQASEAGRRCGDRGILL